jgi:cobalamin biosynthetic protein CobC
MLAHGGNLREAAARYGRPIEDWLDLSTGINPEPYPVPDVGRTDWHRLPEPDRDLSAAAAAYYGAPALLPVAGTQAAIQGLPRLRPCVRVVVAAPSYAEHAHGWRREGHAVREVTFERLGEAVADCEVMVVCNPNNPTGAIVAPEILLGWAEALAARGGWLVVDEAFGDTMPQLSVAAYSGRPGLIVLRSLGKFFGLAGLRLGFVAAEAQVLAQLADQLGPWAVSGPAQRIGTAALRDHAWQTGMRVQLARAGERLRGLLGRQAARSQGTDLFQWWPETDPEAFSNHMAERGIWVRCFAGAARGIRLGLPLHEADWQRLERALTAWRAIEEAA